MSPVRHRWKFRGQDSSQPDGRLVFGTCVPRVKEKNIGPWDSNFFLNYIYWEGGGLVRLSTFPRCRISLSHGVLPAQTEFSFVAGF